VHADYREDDLETLRLPCSYTGRPYERLRRVSRKLIKTTKVHVNPRNARADRASLEASYRERERERETAAS